MLLQDKVSREFARASIYNKLKVVKIELSGILGSANELFVVYVKVNWIKFCKFLFDKNVRIFGCYRWYYQLDSIQCEVE